jgi:hypothetical protein
VDGIVGAAGTEAVGANKYTTGWAGVKLRTPAAVLWYDLNTSLVAGGFAGSWHA